MTTSGDRIVPLNVALGAVIHVTRWMGHVLLVDLVGLVSSVAKVIYKYIWCTDLRFFLLVNKLISFCMSIAFQLHTCNIQSFYISSHLKRSNIFCQNAQPTTGARAALPDVVLVVIIYVIRVMEAVIVNQDGRDRHATLVTNYCLIIYKL